MRRFGTWDLESEQDRLGSCGFTALVQHVEVAGQGTAREEELPTCLQ
jgi:hypothetical protein